jgi:hypothetical protein
MENAELKKAVPLYVYGTIIIIMGILLMVFNDCSFDFVLRIVVVGAVTAAVFAFVTAIVRDRKQVQYAYHEMHAFAFLTYGLATQFYAKNFDQLIFTTAFLFLYYFFSEIAFSNWIFNLMKKVVVKILLIRLALAVLCGVGTVYVMSLASNDYPRAMFCYGILFVLVGVNILFYRPVMRRMYVLKTV